MPSPNREIKLILQLPLVTISLPIIVRKGVLTPPPFQNFPHPPPIPRPPTLAVNSSSQVFLINRNASVKLCSINTTHVKQEHDIGFSIFKFTLKYMLGNVYVNEIHARQCLYIISSYCGGFPHPFNFFVVSKGILHV